MPCTSLGVMQYLLGSQSEKIPIYLTKVILSIFCKLIDMQRFKKMLKNSSIPPDYWNPEPFCEKLRFIQNQFYFLKDYWHSSRKEDWIQPRQDMCISL